MTKQEDVEEEARNYFLNIFTSENNGDMDDVLRALDAKVTEEMNDVLTKPFSVEEVLKAFK